MGKESEERENLPAESDRIFKLVNSISDPSWERNHCKRNNGQRHITNQVNLYTPKKKS